MQQQSDEMNTVEISEQSVMNGQFSPLKGKTILFMIWNILTILFFIGILIVYYRVIPHDSQIIVTLNSLAQNEVIRSLFAIVGIYLFESWLFDAYSNLWFLGSRISMSAQDAVKKPYKAVYELYQKMTHQDLSLVISIWYISLVGLVITFFLTDIRPLLFTGITFCSVSILITKAIYHLQTTAFSSIKDKVVELPTDSDENAITERVTVTNTPETQVYLKHLRSLCIILIILTAGFMMFGEAYKLRQIQKEIEITNKFETAQQMLSTAIDSKLINSYLLTLSSLDDKIADNSITLESYFKQIDSNAAALTLTAQDSKKGLEEVMNKITELVDLPELSPKEKNALILEIELLKKVNAYQVQVLILATTYQAIATFSETVGLEAITEQTLSDNQKDTFTRLINDNQQAAEKLSVEADTMKNSAAQFKTTVDSF